MWLKLRRQIGQWRGVLFTAPSVAGLVILAASTGCFQLLEWVALDQFFRLRPQEPIDSRIVVVTVDDSDIERIGQWPIPDETLAQLITKLNAQNPRAIGLDLYRNLPVQPGHQELVKVFKNTPNLIGVEKVVKNKVPPPPTLKQLNQVAIADLVLDADGKVRRGLLSVKPNNSPTRESLGVKLALKYLEAEGITLRMADERKKQLGLGKAIFSPFTGNEGGYVRTDSGGYQIFLNFRGKPENFLTVSLTQVLENEIPPDLVQDRIVFIGATGHSLNDLFLTPYSSTFFTSPERMPGVFVHANLTSQILSAAIDGRVLIQTWVDSIEWLWILGWSFTGAVGHWILLQTQVSKNNVSTKGTLHSIYLILAGGSLIAVSYVAFLNGWWIPVVTPLLALVGSAIGMAFYHSFELQQEKADLEILLETTTEHYDTVATELQNKAEEAIRESERRLAQFLEAVSVGVTVIDATGKPYFANQRAQELLGKGVLPSVTVDELAQVYQYYIAGTNQVYPVAMLPIVQALKGKRTTADDIEIHRGEQIIPIEAWGTPIYDEQGNLAYAIAAFQDITERKRSEEALRQAEQKYRQIFENALEGIFQTTLDGRFQSANPALAHLYGYDSPEALMATLTDIQHQLYVNPQRWTEFIKVIQQQGAVSGFESQVYRQDGSMIWISENARAVYDANGAILYYQGFVVDITDRKKAEAERIKFTQQLYQLNQANERFVPRQFLQLLNKESIIDVDLGDQVQLFMSILFADIRDFTSLSESMTPEENFKFINDYLSQMEPAIRENNGFIDKYIGDAIMALFSNSANDALSAGIDMLHRLSDYNKNRNKLGYPPVKIGIGINTGSMMLGTVGGPTRMDSTVISDAVNLASRLEELTKFYGVSLLISHYTFMNLHHPIEYAFRIVDRVKVKGKSQSVSVFEVFEADPPEIKEGKLATKSLFEQALFLYNKQAFREAGQLFNDCLKLAPSDPVAKIYWERCQIKHRDKMSAIADVSHCADMSHCSGGLFS